MSPIGPSSELTHAGRPYELTLLVSTVLVLFELNSCDGNDAILRSLCARETVQLLQQEAPDFISRDLWLPNSPDLNPVDY